MGGQRLAEKFGVNKTRCVESAKGAGVVEESSKAAARGVQTETARVPALPGGVHTRRAWVGSAIRCFAAFESGSERLAMGWVRRCRRSRAVHDRMMTSDAAAIGEGCADGQQQAENHYHHACKA